MNGWLRRGRRALPRPDRTKSALHTKGDPERSFVDYFGVGGSRRLDRAADLGAATVKTRRRSKMHKAVRQTVMTAKPITMT